MLLGGGHPHVEVLRQFGACPVPGVRFTLIAASIATPYRSAPHARVSRRSLGALSTSWLRRGRACSRTAPDPQQHGRRQHRQLLIGDCAGSPVAACCRATWRATTATRSATWTCRCWPLLRGRALSSPPPPALTPRSDHCSSWALPLSPRLAVHDVPTFLEQLLLRHQCQLQQLFSMHRQRECFQWHTGYRAASWTDSEIFKLITNVAASTRPAGEKGAAGGPAADRV